MNEMIEAVNSVVSNASALRGAADQVSAQRALTANPARVQEVAQPSPELPQVPYISPYISIDTNYNKAVLQIRDSDTGDVVRQFPSEESLEVRRLQQLRESRSAEVQDSAPQPEPQQPAPQTTELSRLSGAPASRDIITVQEVTSAPPANNSTSPQAATAAFSGGGSSAPQTPQARVSVLA